MKAAAGAVTLMGPGWQSAQGWVRVGPRFSTPRSQDSRGSWVLSTVFQSRDHRAP